MRILKTIMKNLEMFNIELSFLIWFKVLFILFIFCVNVVLLLKEFKDKDIKYLEAGFRQKIKSLTTVRSLAAFSLFGVSRSNWVARGKDLSENAPERELDLDLDIKQSMVVDWSWFETLNGIKKLAVTLILFKSVLLSSLISIIFIYYGDILLKNFDIENKYPKLAKIIIIRRKFSKYYFIINCLFIFGVIIVECVLSMAILAL